MKTRFILFAGILTLGLQSHSKNPASVLAEFLQGRGKGLNRTAHVSEFSKDAASRNSNQTFFRENAFGIRADTIDPEKLTYSSLQKVGPGSPKLFSFIIDQSPHGKAAETRILAPTHPDNFKDYRIRRNFESGTTVDESFKIDRWNGGQGTIVKTSEKVKSTDFDADLQVVDGSYYPVGVKVHVRYKNGKEFKGTFNHPDTQRNIGTAKQQISFQLSADGKSIQVTLNDGSLHTYDLLPDNKFRQRGRASRIVGSESNRYNIHAYATPIEEVPTPVIRVRPINGAWPADGTLPGAGSR